MLLLLGKYFIGITAYLGHLALNKRQIKISNRQAAFAQRLVEKSAFSTRHYVNAKRLVGAASRREEKKRNREFQKSFMTAI